jgi:hypothetical protein
MPQLLDDLRDSSPITLAILLGLGALPLFSAGKMGRMCIVKDNFIQASKVTWESAWHALKRATGACHAAAARHDEAAWQFVQGVCFSK